MRTWSLLAVALSSTAIRTEAVVGLQEFQGRTAPLVDTAYVDDYAVLSCAQVEEARCAGQCAELWCDSNKIGDCTPDFRQVIRVADRCANCEPGDLILSRGAFQQLSGANTYWVPVRWRCVDCGTSIGNCVDSNVRVIEKTTRPASDSRAHATLEKMSDRAIEDGRASGRDVSFHHSASADNDTAGSFDAEVEIPSADNSDESGYEYSNSESDNSEFWSGSGSTKADIKRWNRQGEKAAPPKPTLPSEPSPTMSSHQPSPSSSISAASSPPPPVPSTTISPTGSSNGMASSVPPTSSQSSGGSSTSVSSSTSTSPANGDSSYPMGTVPSLADNPLDARSTSPGLSSSSSTTETTDKYQSPTSTTISPPQAPDGSTYTSDDNLSATSAVTKSPFFYASIVLGIVGLIGVVVGYRAKQKRNHRNEVRAFPMSARTATPVSNSRPAPSSLATLAARTRLDSHSIVIL